MAVQTMSDFDAGDVVWMQLYSPIFPSWQSSLVERIDSGQTYGPRRRMRLLSIFRDGVDGPCFHAGDDGLHPLSGKPLPEHAEHFYLVDADTGRDESWCDDNWCVLERIVVDGALW